MNYFSSFVLHDLYAEPAFLISMKLSLCWEANQPCGTVYNIFDKVRLPKKVCDWDKKFLQNGRFLRKLLGKKRKRSLNVSLINSFYR